MARFEGIFFANRIALSTDSGTFGKFPLNMTGVVRNPIAPNLIWNGFAFAARSIEFSLYKITESGLMERKFSAIRFNI